MKAIVKTGPRPGIALEEVEEPKVQPGGVLIEVESASVCGTDYTLANWTAGAADWGSSFPLTMGHEYCGTVVEVGADVDPALVGRRIAGESHVSCGTCHACTHDARHNCLGLSIPGVSCNGAFAPLLAVPASACFTLADGIGPEAVLFESAGVAVHAVQQAGDIAGALVAVTGAGPVGMFLVATLRALGAGEIVVVEPTESRRRRAEALGAVTFAPDEGEAFVAYCRERGPLRGAQVGFEVSGTAPAYASLFQALGLESTLVSVGHSATPVPVHITRDVNLRVITWKGVYGRRIWSSWELLQDLVVSGRVDLAPFLEDEIALAELPARFDGIRALPGKVLVRP